MINKKSTVDNVRKSIIMYHRLILPGKFDIKVMASVVIFHIFKSIFEVTIVIEMITMTHDLYHFGHFPSKLIHRK